jgi:hypothetical protein
MSCEVTQRRLLGSECPEQPTTEVKQHLARCPVCRALQRRLVQLERQIPSLEVPPSTAKARTIRRLLESPPAPSPPPPPSRVVARVGLPGEQNRQTPKERGLQKMAVAFALAAGLAAFALGYWAWPQPGPGQPDPLAARKMERDRRLAEARTPRERVEVLAGLAEQLHKEALAHAAASAVDAEKLALVARFYSEVVRDDLLAHARKVPIVERAALLGAVAVGLSGAESELQRALAAPTPPAVSHSLQQMALAARDGRDRLRVLMNESA